MTKSVLILVLLVGLATALGLFLILGHNGGGEKHYALGNELLLENDNENALKEYRIALRKGLDNPMVHNNIGFTLFRLGRYSDAAEEYKIALDMKSDFGLARLGFTLVENLLREGVSHEAYQLYEAARSSATVDSAMGLYRMALDISPNFSMARFKLARLYMKKTRGGGEFSDSDSNLLKEASDEFQKVLDVNPKFLFAYIGLSEVYTSQGAEGKAREMLEKCIELGSETGVARIASERLEALGEGK